MRDKSDHELIREFADDRSDPAFAELVRRHVDHVYSAALRMVRDAHLAEDVSQAVFLALARGAKGLREREVLSGWLHQTTRHVSAQLVRCEVRRRLREQERYQMDASQGNEGEARWGEIEPHLDAALGELSESDRDMVTMRYFERKTAREMSLEMGIGEEAAQKRVNRAVERLRENLAKRGVVSGAGGLGIVLAAHVVQAAPVGLATSISASVLCGVGLGSAATGVFQATAVTQAMVMTTIQKVVVVGTMVGAIGFGIHESRQRLALERELSALRVEHGGAEEQLARLGGERDEALARLAALKLEVVSRGQDAGEIGRLRAENARLRKSAAARSTGTVAETTRAAAESWLGRAQALRSHSPRFPGANLPELALATDEDWLDASRENLDRDADIRRALSQVRHSVENKVVIGLHSALQRFIQAGTSGFPASLAELEPYLEGEVTADMTRRWRVLPAKELVSIVVGGNFVITQEPIDREFDHLWGVGVDGIGTAPIPKGNLGTVGEP